ncbi:MAG: tRNA (N6-isopentenyl adenosine(37)-C2)-methylthiotransferase MiaB, partial [Candidatus Fonsibacter sp.]
IREKAAEKVYSDIGKLKKNFKGRVKPLFILVGCIAQAEGKEIFERSDFVDLVIGPQSYHLLPTKVLDFLKRKEKTVSTEFDQIIKFDTLDNIKPSRTSKVSEFVTVQEGCDKFCSFCVVPYTRGPEFSRSVKSIIAE